MPPTDDEFFAAIRAGDEAAVRETLAQHPGLAEARNAQGISALMWALYVRQPAIAAAIRAAGAPLDVFEAVAIGDGETARGRLAADPTLAQAWSADGFTALHYAAFFGHPELAEPLLAAGADPAAQARNPMRVTPLHSAAAAHVTALVRRLLEAGAAPDARQQGGFTALMEAAASGDLELADVLLAAGADPLLAAEDGRTCEALAREKGHDALVARLAPGANA